MRQKEEKLIITFHTTAGAIAMEKYCKKNGLPGRLIPGPRCLTSDCGMAWSAPYDQRPVFEAREDLPEYAGMHQVLL